MRKQKNRITISQINSQPTDGGRFANYFVKIGYQKDGGRLVHWPSKV
jgi:hypothetical protein